MIKGTIVLALHARPLATLMQRALQAHGYTVQVCGIVLGLPARRRWEELLPGSLVNRLLRLSSDIDIHLVPRRREESSEDP